MPEKAIEALCEIHAEKLTDEELERISEGITGRLMRSSRKSWRSWELERRSKMQDEIVDEIESQAAWRWSKSAEYPRDKRNEKSAEALQHLAEEMKAMPDDDPLFAEYERLLNLPVSDDFSVEVSEAFGEQLRTFGFHGPQSHDPREFLKERIEILKKARSEHFIRKRRVNPMFPGPLRSATVTPGETRRGVGWNRSGRRVSGIASG